MNFLSVGGADANSFASLDAATEYLDARLNADSWIDADEEDQIKSLIEATRDLSNLEPLYMGYRTTSTQALAFPRTWVINKKAPWTEQIGLTGFPEYDDDVIPPDLISATCELALEYLRAGTTDVAAGRSATATGALIENTVGPLTKRWATPTGAAATPPLGFARYPRVVMLIAPLFTSSGAANAVERS